MHAFVLQDFVTIRGGSTVATITQSEHEWLQLDGYEDLVVWIDVREVTLANNTFVQINLQTAPLKDEFLFVNMESAPLTVAAALSTPSIRKIIMAGSTAPAVPLGKFVRWQLVTSNGGSVNNSWDVTFRILGCANPIGGGAGMTARR